ncbi:MAG: hypothetical protein KGS48_12065 [Bacteroidetes bacterium]|nr:hypothetical protein [Bacteroidota bacterium]
MKKLLIFLPVLLLAGLMFQSCKKDSDSSATADQLIAEDIVAHNDLSEQIDADVDASVDAFMGADDRSDCPTVSFAQPKGTWPNTITLDYSSAGCTKNGYTYKGKIVITQTNPMNVTGASRSFTFDNFYFENVKFEGSKTVTNAGLNAANQPFFTVSVNETLLYPGGAQATYSSTRTRTLVEGASTTARIDDVWNISGSASGTNRNGVSYTLNITSPLVKKVACPWISAGVLQFIANGKTRSLDFGDGTCDKDATLTLADGTTKSVKIRHFWWR